MLQFTSICILININLPKLAKTIFTLLLSSARNITLSKTRPGCTGGVQRAVMRVKLQISARPCHNYS